MIIEGIEAHVFCWFGKTVMGRRARGHGRRRGQREREMGERERETDRQIDRQTETQRENSNSKTLFYKDCSLG